MPIRFNCEHCGKEVETSPAFYNRRKHHFCSKECFMLSKTIHKSRMENAEKLKPKTCTQCGKIFYSPFKTAVFCSTKCKSKKTQKENIINILGDYAEVILNNKNGELKCLIDVEDIEKIKPYRVLAQYCPSTKSYYAKASERNVKITERRMFQLHRIITDCPNGLEVDHINHDTLDNRKENLKVCTHYENMQNVRRNNNKNGYNNMSYIRYRKDRKQWFFFNKSEEKNTYKYFKNLDDALAFKKEFLKST